ncbi:MAG: 50S ribosomal protein L37ae [Candidatus Aenigmarchaeota archaeon]|nr:50S ribosomal protein L37ae [Candidatus Aenigmarchaeota archaeon]
MATKKVAASGKFGPRYGKKLRVSYNKSYEQSKTKYTCPNCSKENSVLRQSFGVWECKNCGKKFASGAYEFKVAK